jgi:hypothetical protein
MRRYESGKHGRQDFDALSERQGRREQVSVISKSIQWLNPRPL